MYPKHRKKILAQIKERMSDKSKSCVLISTSLVEAGVDLDFNSVYRQVAGVDSVIQAAGRQMALAFRLDSLGNALTPVYEWGATGPELTRLICAVSRLPMV